MTSCRAPVQARTAGLAVVMPPLMRAVQLEAVQAALQALLQETQRDVPQ
jgi:hypothetical protein